MPSHFLPARALTLRCAPQHGYAVFSYARRGGRVGKDSPKNRAVGEDVLLSAIALAIGEPARTRMLLSLLDGRARTSTELATLAEVTPSTASAHLNRLRQSRLICVVAQGRHRYYSLRGQDVARVLEGLSVLAGGTTKKFVPSTPEALRRARTCYDHMAGAVAVALHDQFVGEGWLVSNLGEQGNAYNVSDAGARTLGRLGIHVADMQGSRRRFAYGCIDWSERRPHIAGALGAELLKYAVTNKWVVRDLNSRTLRLTRVGEKDALRAFGIRFD